VSFVSRDQDGHRLRLALVRTARGVWVGWPGGARFFSPERAESAAGASGPAEVRAPMTGRVVAVLVAPGREVRQDEVLVILQAMKMEYRLTSSCDGVVETVRCAAGEMVDLGATLLTLQPRPPSGPPPLDAAARPARKKKR